jgi:hypothetical protein
MEARIENYLGKEVAQKMKRAAMGKGEEDFVNAPAAG